MESWGLQVENWGLRVESSELRVQGWEFRGESSEVRVQGWELWLVLFWSCLIYNRFSTDFINQYIYNRFSIKSNHNYQLSTFNSQFFQLFVECFFKCREFRLAANATFPPRLNKAETIAHKLDICRRYAQDTYLDTVVLAWRIDEYQYTV